MSWKNQEVWQQMLAGKNCPMCVDIHLEENEHGFLIKEFEHSFVRLPKNQHYYGWVVVFLKRHASELYELEDLELDGFMREVAVVAKAVNQIFQPVKINYAVFGSLCPHVHCHIIPRRFEDDPHAPIKMDEAEKFLPDEEYQEIIAKFREALR